MYLNERWFALSSRRNDGTFEFPYRAALRKIADIPRQDGQDKYMLHKLRVIQSIRGRDNQVRLSVARPVVFVASFLSPWQTRAVSADFIRFLTKVPGVYRWSPTPTVTTRIDGPLSDRVLPINGYHVLGCACFEKVSRYARESSVVKLRHLLGPGVALY